MKPECWAIDTLVAFKTDPQLKPAPMIVLAGSISPADIHDVYAAGAACVFDMTKDLSILRKSCTASKTFGSTAPAFPSKSSRYTRDPRRYRNGKWKWFD